MSTLATLLSTLDLEEFELSDLLRINYKFWIIILEQNIIVCFLIHILSTLFNNIVKSIILYGFMLKNIMFWCLVLILGLRPIYNLVLTQGNTMLLICVLNEVHDTTKVLLQYNILFIY